MTGIGIDLCEVARIERAEALTGRFLEKYYTEEERDYIRSRGKAGFESAAAFFAAKEAFLKALGLGVGQGIHLAEIGVSHTPEGAPCYCLRGMAKSRLAQSGGRKTFLSLTHEAGMAAAVCVIE